MASGSFSETYKGFTLRTDWNSTHNIAGNYSDIICNHYLVCGKYYSLSISSRTNSCTAGEYKEFTSGSISKASGSEKTIHLGTTTHRVYHNEDGTKSISASTIFNINAKISSVQVNNITASGTMTLDNIPRYTSITKFIVEKKDETSVKVTWDASDACDKIWYSKDNGATWAETSGYPNFNITGLNAGTSYNFKIRVRRSDSQLTTDSGTYNQTTYDYPHCIESPDFIIGNELTLKFYNPLNRNITIIGYKKEDNKKLFEGTTSGTIAKGFKDEDSINNQYASIPNAKSGKYKVTVTYNGVNKTRDNENTYSINESICTPTVGSFSYKDSKSSTVNITENNQRIIRNNSNLLFTVGSATPKKSASISKYEVIFNEVTKSRTTVGDLDFGTINLSSNEKATLKVTDSRGLTATKEITIIIDDWILPTAIIDLKRKNNFYAETYIKVDASYSSLNSKNSITIQVQYKKVSDSNYSSLQNLSDNVQATFDLDNESQWNIKVIVKDKIGTTTYNLVLDRGIPIAYFDRLLLSVGINCIPKKSKSFELNGYEIIESGSNENGIYTKWADGSMVCCKNVNGTISCTNSLNGWYETDSIDLGEFAIPFIDMPYVFANNASSNENQQMAIIESISNKTENSCGQVSLCRPTSVDTLTYSLDIIAFGRWK